MNLITQKYTLSRPIAVFFGFLTLLFLSGTLAWAQVGRPAVPGTSSGTTEQVQILNADSLEVSQVPGSATRRLVGHVRLKHKGALMFCDLAIQNASANVVEAYGNVRILQGDTITVKGDTMYYYGNTRSSTLLSRVSLRDTKMTLTTSRLDYDMANGIAHYPSKGRIVDKDNVLTSEEGYYDTRFKQFTFIRNVKLVNPKTTLTADSLLYNSATKMATFQGPTKIVNKDGTLVAREGTYNTVTRVSNFRKRATAYAEKYTLTGDTLDFDNQTELGIAKGNVVLVGKENNTIITGDNGRYNGKAGISRVTGNAVVRSLVSKDTLYMRADTLFSYDTPSGSTEKKPRKLVGQKNVWVYKSDLQSRCDSLVYAVSDSTIYFYKKPIVWSDGYQMEADTLTAKLKNNRINTLLLRGRSFVISQDSLQYFNQIKGRSITASFKNVLDTIRPKPAATARTRTKTARTATAKTTTPPRTTTAVAGPFKVEDKTELNRVVVEGNGQSIYYVVDDKNVFTGMNRVDCSKMTIDFKKGRVGNIRFYGSPDGALTPPKLITDEKKKLDGFRWRVAEKPTKEQVINGAKAVGNKPVATTSLPLPVTTVPAATTAVLKQQLLSTGLNPPLDKSGIKFDANFKPIPSKPGQKK
ncbi:OstA-like protein [uncultured Fibrella sp.]|uniref:OstA-like protein n=1 Tax=uncultured Fibrella sp. TaxID=1284596 RepID=UPI0035CB8AD8